MKYIDCEYIYTTSIYHQYYILLGLYILYTHHLQIHVKFYICPNKNTNTDFQDWILQIWILHIPPAFVSSVLSCLSLSCIQVGVYSNQEPCDGQRVLQQLSCPGAHLFHQRVGAEEGSALHRLRGGVPGCGRGAGTPLPSGRHHQDVVQGHSLDLPLWRCEYKQISCCLKMYLDVCFYPFSHHQLDGHLSLMFVFHRFSLSGQHWKREESPSVNPGGNTSATEFKNHLSRFVKMSCIPFSLLSCEWGLYGY